MHKFKAGLLAISICGSLHAQTPDIGPISLHSGMEIYRAACIGCHGPNGQGMPESTVGFEKPKTFPDFTKCDQTTPEYNRDYKAAIRDGGPARGFSTIMPSFREALTAEQIDMVVQTLRGFCKEKGWPRGELNLPLALVTEKPFPEDETVIISGVNVQGAPGISNELIYEQRFGKMYQIEVAVPFSFLRQDLPGLWYAGIGDITLGLKRVLFSSLRTGSIMSVQGEVVLPTGNRAHGLGTGVTSFGTFLSYGQFLPRNAFFQFQGGANLPTDTAKSPQSAYWRGALGKSFSQGSGLGRQWSPMVEMVATRDLQHGAKTDWDVVPQFQVTVSRRQHVRANFGVRVPVTDTVNRPIQLMAYVLWDWFDGGLLEGWK